MTTQLIKRESDDDDLIGSFLDPARLFNAIWMRKWIILSLSAAMSVAAFLWTGAKPAVYRADATMLIESAGLNPLLSQYMPYGAGYVGFEYMETQFELLRSLSVAERVVRKLGLHQMERFRPGPPAPPPWYKFDLSMLKPAGFNPAPEQPWTMPSEEEQILALTDMIVGRLQVEQLGGSNMVMVSYSADDARLAASITNTYLEEYIESHLDSSMAATMQATDWLTDRLADLRENLKRSEERLQAFRDQEQLVDIQGVATLSSQEITSLNSTYTESRQVRLELEAMREELQRMGDASVEELLTVPAIFNHAVIRSLRQAESDSQRAVSELSRRYGPKHPKMIEAVNRLSSAKVALEDEVQNVVYGIEREYQLALASETNSKRQLDATRLDLQDLNRKEFLLREYEREVETNTQLYEVFFTRLRETDETGAFEAPPARIVDLSRGGYRVGPNVQRAAMLAFAMSFMALCGLAVFLDVLDNTIKTPADVDEKLGLPLLGTLPLLAADKGGSVAEYWQDQSGTFAEAVRTIRTGVVLSNIDNPSRIIVITSSIPGEGKSTLALNLAASFAQLEKTILIGADMRRPTLAKRCNLSPKHPGLSNYVAGSAPLEECIAEFGDTGLSIMPAGLIPSNPLELLSSNRFREALELLKTRYDRIVIDSAPIAAVSDALMLASYADALLYAVKADDTATTIVQKSIRQLLAAHDLLTGVVLTHFNPSKASRYYGEGRYKYGYYNAGYYHSSDTHG